MVMSFILFVVLLGNKNQTCLPNVSYKHNNLTNETQTERLLNITVTPTFIHITPSACWVNTDMDLFITDELIDDLKVLNLQETLWPVCKIHIKLSITDLMVDLIGLIHFRVNICRASWTSRSCQDVFISIQFKKSLNVLCKKKKKKTFRLFSTRISLYSLSLVLCNNNRGKCF